MSNTWEQVMALKGAGKHESKGVANTLTLHDIETIVAVIDFFGGDYRQDILDLRDYKYRVFDWLGMRIHGSDNASAQDRAATKVLAYSFIKSGGVPSKFINDLRVTDYQVVTDWEGLEL